MARRGANEGSVYQRTSDGKWIGSIHLGYEGGRRRRKTVYGATQQEVIRRLRALQFGIEQGVDVTTPETLKLGAYLVTWLETVRQSLRPSTFESYSSWVRLYLEPDFRHRRIKDVTPSELTRYLSRLVTERNLAPRSARHVRAILRKALRDAEIDGIVPRNVAALATPPRVAHREAKTWSPSEAKQFIAGISGHRLAHLYVVTLATGMRLGEATGLAWEDVDLEAGTLRVRQALQRASGGWRLVEPKSHRSRRKLWLPKVAIEALRLQRELQDGWKAAAGSSWVNEYDLVFTTPTGTPLNPSTTTRALKEECVRIGVPALTFHELRHSCASFLIAEGIPPRVVMEQLGHSQISLTMNTYAHILPTLQKEAADRIDDILNSETQ